MRSGSYAEPPPPEPPPLPDVSLDVGYEGGLQDAMGAGAGAGFGAAAFFGVAAFFGAAARAFAFLTDFFATARFVFLRAGAAFFALLPFLVFDFAFFAFFAIINSRRCD
jgi:hypothetical protein